MTKHLYVIRDILAEQVVGGILMFPGDPAAVRFFQDVCTDKQTTVNKHIGDHELIHIGTIDESSATIASEGIRTVLTGAALLASMQPGDA